MDVVESNEAFAVQACAVTKRLALDPGKVDRNGSGIPLGHSSGGAQGIAAILERVC